VRLGNDLCKVDLGPSQLRGGRARKRPAVDDAVSKECVELLDRIKRLRFEDEVTAAAAPAPSRRSEIERT
jgi:hypothetical protein